MRWEGGAWRAGIGAIRHARQDRVAAHETESPGYTLVTANLAWHRDTADGSAIEVFVDGTNLLDEQARPHTSFLKDLAPVIEFGLCNATMHKRDEAVAVDDLEVLARIYSRIARAALDKGGVASR